MPKITDSMNLFLDLFKNLIYFRFQIRTLIDRINSTPIEQIQQMIFLIITFFENKDYFITLENLEHKIQILRGKIQALIKKNKLIEKHTEYVEEIIEWIKSQKIKLLANNPESIEKKTELILKQTFPP